MWIAFAFDDVENVEHPIVLEDRSMDDNTDLLELTPHKIILTGISGGELHFLTSSADVA